MEKFKFILFSVITLALVGLLGYWAVTTLESGPEHKKDEIIKNLEKENEELKVELKGLKSELSILQSKVQVPAPVVKEEPKQEETKNKYQDLINELQKMADSNVLLKLKSTGPRVGTVQKFLNIYNKTSNRVDNDYGAGTVASVKAFQKAVGLTADGEAGKGTFEKMIDWLKKEG
jgi:murein L,D-transpeptidase YcbB/YkuD